MNYTNEQYGLMERLQDGLLWGDLREQDREILCYLDRKGIAIPRAYIQDGLWFLTQKGEAILHTHRMELQEREDQAKKEICETAKSEAEKKSEKKFQKANTILGALLGFTLGVVADHIGEIMAFLRGLFAWAGEWIASFF